MFLLRLRVRANYQRTIGGYLRSQMVDWWWNPNGFFANLLGPHRGRDQRDRTGGFTCFVRCYASNSQSENRTIVSLGVRLSRNLGYLKSMDTTQRSQPILRSKYIRRFSGYDSSYADNGVVVRAKGLRRRLAVGLLHGAGCLSANDPLCHPRISHKERVFLVENIPSIELGVRC